MASGQVIRSHSNIYYVLVDGQEVECRPRGKFRLEDQQVLAGDRVEVTLLADGEGRIDRILPRQSELSRPRVANVDRCVVVFTLHEPEADFRFLDRVLAHTEQAGVEAVIALNKVDLCTPEEVEAFVATYGPAGVGYPVIPISAATGAGLDQLIPYLAGRTSVLAGQSGVGKSRLTAALVPGREIRVGEVSRKLRRGRHTTRHVELIPLPFGGVLADAPGFTHLEFAGMEPRDLADCFREFREPAAECRFDDCLHRAEPDCGVKAAVAEGRIPRHRYEHYLVFLEEIEAARKW
ncbi:MAG: ribosome small subunit-dependent GTPase A [Bacillota bacterium]|nr:MAG: ribosome small subunit-dependent GTPase A [Bacillota bacterium]